MKKIALILTVVIVLAMMDGCLIQEASRTPISANEFTTKAEAAGYRIQDAADQASGAAEDYLIAIQGTSAIDYQIEFFVVSTVDQAKATYQGNLSKIESQKGAISTNLSADKETYAYYKLASDNRYYVISRIENTLVYIDASEKYKDEIVKFLRDIGY